MHQETETGLVTSMFNILDYYFQQYSESSDLKEYAEGCEDEAQKRGGKVAKRRKSAPPMYVKQYWHPLDKLTKSNIAKL